MIYTLGSVKMANFKLCMFYYSKKKTMKTIAQAALLLAFPVPKREGDMPFPIRKQDLEKQPSSPLPGGPRHSGMPLCRPAVCLLIQTSFSRACTDT